MDDLHEKMVAGTPKRGGKSIPKLKRRPLQYEACSRAVPSSFWNRFRVLADSLYHAVVDSQVLEAGSLSESIH